MAHYKSSSSSFYSHGNSVCPRVRHTLVGIVTKRIKRLCFSHSQPGMSDWAGVMEAWTWTYYNVQGAPTPKL